MAVLVFLIALSVFIIARIWKRCRSLEEVPAGLKKLPGPRGWPLIGSVPEIPEALGWIKFSDWGKQYGPIYQCNLAGTNHVWISSDEIAHDLLSKKGAIYSDRPHIPALIDDNRTSAQYLPLLSKNDGWTRQRKFANNIMRQSEKLSFNQYPELESIRMCVELMTTPEKYNHVMESFVARVTSRLAWGHAEAGDELKQRARELLVGVSPTGALGNKLPFLMSLPDWMSPAKAWERRRAKTERAFFNTMQQQVRDDMAEKKAPSGTWMKYFFDNADATEFTSELEGAYAVGMHGIAGALTIAAPMQAFCLAMCHYPQYLQPLQQELDEVCGDRMPMLDDKPRLPFLRAVIREVIRWRPPVPTGIPHYLIQDDIYKGFHIPKGSVMHPLEWAISRDPELYPDPETFNPLRWTEPQYPTYKAPLSLYPSILNMSQFGYGRRTCQGQTVTEADLLVGIGSIAWLFNISKDGLPLAEFTAGLLTPPTTPLSTSFQTKTDKMATLDYMGAREGTVVNEKAGILNEECVVGLTEQPRREERAEHRQSAQGKDTEDPTLIYSTLLIAKPLPFKFHLSVRSRSRAEMVLSQFVQKKMEGEFPPDREYWGPHQGAGQELGWSKV